MRHEWSKHIGLLFTDGETSAYVPLGALAEAVHRFAERERKLREAATDYLNNDGSRGDFDAGNLQRARIVLNALLKEE